MSITVHSSHEQFFLATSSSIERGKAYMTKFGSIMIGRNVGEILLVALDGGLVYTEEDCEVQEVDLDIYVKYK